MVAAKRHNSKFNDRDKKQNHKGGRKNPANKQKFGNQKEKKTVVIVVAGTTRHQSVKSTKTKSVNSVA